jgi:cytoskeletal protein CcmA (bactofilin family)
VFWKRGEEPTSGTINPQREWTTGEPAARELGATEVVAPTPVLRASLGADTSVSGRLSFTAPTRIDGKLRGEVRASDLLVIGEQGYVEGIVRALKLVVLGEVRGEVRGAERVEIGPGGRLMGSVETHSLVVKEGGYLDGDCRIAPPRASVHVLRRAEKASC